MSEIPSLGMRQGAFFFEFYNKIEQILSLGDEAGDRFSVYLVKTK